MPETRLTRACVGREGRRTTGDVTTRWGTRELRRYPHLSVELSSQGVMFKLVNGTLILVNGTLINLPLPRRAGGVGDDRRCLGQNSPRLASRGTQ